MYKISSVAVILDCTYQLGMLVVYLLIRQNVDMDTLDPICNVGLNCVVFFRVTCTVWFSQYSYNFIIIIIIVLQSYNHVHAHTIFNKKKLADSV